MAEIFDEIFHNKVLWITLISWAVAQSTKILIGLIQGKKFNFFWVLRTGGLPSAHSAAVVALSLSLGKEVGFSSGLFALSAIFALITMFDAQTWRRYIGVQARVLNKMMDDIQEKKKIEESRLKELVGHTPVEVLAGACIGIVISIMFW
ncbi:MAG: divergent PAP2 family protein [Candidatus Omnitrophica bacterium]|nr:divergent PAP2 family protein [Candidatus Omnitrophota bacterium]MBD3269046.1 divergent PAP2 family protein [Candidatus Omnitrophota bacterium]